MSGAKRVSKKKKHNNKPAKRKKSTATRTSLRRKTLSSPASRKAKSAQIHQGIGPLTQPETPEIPDDASEYGGES
jgi:hypothetical protein